MVSSRTHGVKVGQLSRSDHGSPTVVVTDMDHHMPTTDHSPRHHLRHRQNKKRTTRKRMRKRAEQIRRNHSALKKQKLDPALAAQAPSVVAVDAAAADEELGVHAAAVTTVDHHEASIRA